jgi:hypothetical protein
MMVMKNEDGEWGWAPNFSGKFDMTPFTHLSKIGCKKCGIAAVKGFGIVCPGSVTWKDRPPELDAQ